MVTTKFQKIHTGNTELNRIQDQTKQIFDTYAMQPFKYYLYDIVIKNGLNVIAHPIGKPFRSFKVCGERDQVQCWAPANAQTFPAQFIYLYANNATTIDLEVW